jgi:hypothetical protein
VATKVTPAVTNDEAYAVAALFDGARRVAQVALCVLALEDVIDLGRDIEAAAILRGVELPHLRAATDANVVPTVAVTGSATVTLHAIEETAIESIGDGANVADVLFELRRAPAMHELIRRCIDGRLVNPRGAKSRRRFLLRSRWEREVSVFGDLDDLASRRLVLAVHGPLVLFESAPEIPLALGLQRRAPANAWMMDGGGFAFGGSDCDDGGGGDC